MHFNLKVCMYSDGFNRNHVHDATYKNYREKFNLFSYGRLDLKRAFKQWTEMASVQN
jgi:hypothetical protein